jgi:acetyltransferase
MEAVLADGGVDAMIVMACPTALASAVDSAREVAAVIEEARTRGAVKPVLTCWLGGKTVAPARALLRAANVPTYDAPVDAARALGHLTGWHAAQALLLRVPPGTAEDLAFDPAAARAVLGAAWRVNLRLPDRAIGREPAAHRRCVQRRPAALRRRGRGVEAGVDLLLLHHRFDGAVVRHRRQRALRDEAARALLSRLAVPPRRRQRRADAAHLVEIPAAH